MSDGATGGMFGSNVVIFGAGGQDGSYVAGECKRRGAAEIHCYSHRSAPACDVADFAAVDSILRKVSPSYVFHLAADSRTSHDALFTNHQAIAGGAVNILEAAYRHVPHARVLLASSGLQFVNVGAPIDESAPFFVGSPYAAARVYATYLARYYREKFGLKTYVAYLFHHESPARTARHTSKMIALAAARAALGHTDKIELGDLTVEKEWAFAGDIAAGMVHLSLQDGVPEAAIGTGVGYTIRDWAEACYSYVGLAWVDFVTTRAGYVAEYPRLISNPHTIRELGWQPAIGFAELARMMVDAALEELATPGTTAA